MLDCLLTGVKQLGSLRLAMSSHFRRFIVPGALWAALLTIRCLLPPACVAQPGPGEESQQGVLLLRNGEVLKGQITRTGDRYCVVVAGGEISVNARDVDFSCGGLEEAYQIKKARVRLGRVEDHLELARWCQRQGLLAHAAQQLVLAKMLNPAHPVIPLLERRVEMSRHQPQPSDGTAGPVDHVLSSDELDRLVRGMPPGTVESFTQTIQPLLINNCTAAGCHGARAENGFRLLRVPSGRPPTRRLTQRNLHATLKWVNRDDPAASPLLTAAITPHGSARAAIFPDHQIAQYQQIVDWVYRVAQCPQPPETAVPVPREEQEEAAAARLPLGNLLTNPSECPSGGCPLPSDGRAVYAAGAKTGMPAASPLDDGGFPTERPAFNSQADPESASGAGSLRATSGTTVPKLDPTAPQFVPTDPFDPQIFNRRFFPANRRRATGVVPPGH